jgi:hypothetical protein
MKCFSKLEQQVAKKSVKKLKLTYIFFQIRAFTTFFGWRIVLEMLLMLGYIVFNFYFMMATFHFATDVTLDSIFMQCIMFLPSLVVSYGMYNICQEATALTKDSIEFARRLDRILMKQCALLTDKNEENRGFLLVV